MAALLLCRGKACGTNHADSAGYAGWAAGLRGSGGGGGGGAITSLLARRLQLQRRQRFCGQRCVRASSCSAHGAPKRLERQLEERAERLGRCHARCAVVGLVHKAWMRHETR